MNLVSEHPFGSGGLRARKFQLDNGLSVVVIADRSAPVCAYHTWFRVGSRDEKPGRTGIAHLFEHLMFNETERLAPGEFDRRMEAIGADTNAATWLDWTYYREVVPTAHLETVMELEAERMARLVLREPQLESERSVVSNERIQRVEDDVDGFLDEELHRLAYDVHPYRWPTIGWMQDIQAITLDDARAFYRTYYAPNNATVVMVGDVDEARALGALERRYGHLPSQALPERVTLVEPPQAGERRKVFAKPVMTDRVLVGWKAVGLADPAHAALEVAAELLFNGQSSTVYRSLVVEKEIASAVSSSVPSFRDPGLFQVMAVLQRGYRAADAEVILYDAVAALASRGPDEAQLARAKNRLLAGQWRGLRPHDGKAEAVGHFEATLGDYRAMFDGWRRLVEVTADDVRSAVATCLDVSQRSVVIAAAPTRAARKVTKGGGKAALVRS